MPSNGDTTQLAQSIGRGLWIGTLGANANALVGSIGAGANANAPGILQTLNIWTRLRGIALQTNTSVDVTVTVSGIGTAGGAVSAPLRKRDGVTKPSVGDVPALWPFEVQWDGNVFRIVGAVASDGNAPLSALLIAGGPWRVLAIPGTTIITVPPGGSVLDVFGCWGAGGGGAGNTMSAGAGGGFSRGAFAVTPGQQIPMTVGAGGTGTVGSNNNTNPGTNGGTTSVGSLCSATGGSGGGPGPQPGGMGYGGDMQRQGAPGQDLDGTNTYAFGGAAPLGGGASTVGDFVAGQRYPGVWPGGGGGGGACGPANGANPSIGSLGANGADGGIIYRLS